MSGFGAARFCVLLLVGLIAWVGLGAAGEAPDALVERVAEHPTVLRDRGTVRSLTKLEPVRYRPLMRRLAADGSQPWDLRATAVTLLHMENDAAAIGVFVSDFDATVVAADEWGDGAFNILAAWAMRRRDSGGRVGRLILFPAGDPKQSLVLNRLAGRPVHEYLRFLLDEGSELTPESVAALAETDDQLTRQLLCWYVGESRMSGMEGFLVNQIGSQRSNSYRSQVDRFFVAALTAGIGELIRQAAPTPRWLEDDATPKGLALESLAVLIPEGTRMVDPEWTAALLEAARVNAGGKKRGQWQVAIDVLWFLHDHQEKLPGRADAALAALARQVLRKRGPLEPFVAASLLHQRAAVPFPKLNPEEQARVWEVAHSTLSREFLRAVVDQLPDETRRSALIDHLLGQEEQAGRGTLHVVRCWGADIEGPGDWALAVADLHITEAVDGVEQVLQTSWTDEAATALAELGEAGAPALARFLKTERAVYLDSEIKVVAIRACLEHLPDAEWKALAAVLRGDRYLAEALYEALEVE